MLVLQLAAQGLSLVPADLRLTPHLCRGPHSEVQCGRLIIWEGTSPPHAQRKLQQLIHGEITHVSKTGPPVAGAESVQNEHSRRWRDGDQQPQGEEDYVEVVFSRDGEMEEKTMPRNGPNREQGQEWKNLEGKKHLCRGGRGIMEEQKI